MQDTLSGSQIIGGPLKHQCGCGNGKTGSDCELTKCADELSAFSLGQLFLAGDKRLEETSAIFGFMSLSEQATEEKYLHDLIYYFLDRDVDGVVTVDEMVRNHFVLISRVNLVFFCPAIPFDPISLLIFPLFFLMF